MVMESVIRNRAGSSNLPVCACCSIPSLASGPVVGLASMVGQRYYPKFVATDVVDDAEGKLPAREAASLVSPVCPKVGMRAKKGDRPFELRDEARPSSSPPSRA